MTISHTTTYTTIPTGVTVFVVFVFVVPNSLPSGHGIMTSVIFVKVHYIAAYVLLDHVARDKGRVILA